MNTHLTDRDSTSDVPELADHQRQGFSWSSAAAIVTYLMSAFALIFWAIPIDRSSATQISQIGLVASILALSTMVTCIAAVMKSLWRFLFLAIAYIALSILLNTKEDGPPLQLLLLLFPLMIGLPTLLTLESIKLFLGRFRRGEIYDDTKEGLQFGLKHLVILTTVVAVLSRISIMLGPWFRRLDAPPPNLSIVFAIVICIMSFNTLLGVWAMLGKNAVVRFLIWFFLAGIAVSFVPWFLARWVQSSGIWTTVLSIAAIATQILLGCLRLDGYRFVKR